MLKDITIGQYFAGDSLIHQLEPRAKLILVIAYIVALFNCKSISSYAVAVVFIIVCYILSGIRFKVALKSLRPIVPILIFTTVINLFFNTSGKILLQWGPLKLTDSGLIFAITIMVRVCTLIIGTSLLTYTTTPIQLTGAIERLLKPLGKLHFPVHEFGMMMTITLRFIPTLIEETDKIMAAQKSRGADFESGNLLQKVKAMIPLLIPLFVSAFRRADDLALAMECRCYHGGEGRTRMRTSHFAKKDYAAFAIMAVLIVCIVVLNGAL